MLIWASSLAALDMETRSLGVPCVRTARDRAEIRKEQRKFLEYHRSLPAIIGHTYALRAINYKKADTFVVFNILTRNGDGSLTVYWKKIEEFPTPDLVR